MMKRLWLLVMVICLSGCWDRVEIEERGFVVGLALDKPEEEPMEETYNDPVEATVQIVIPRKLSPENRSPKPFENMSIVGDSIFEQVRNLSENSGRGLYFPHNRIWLISEEVAKTPYLLSEVTEVALRDDDARRNVKVFIAKDSAKKMFEVEPINEAAPAGYIEMLGENHSKTAKIFESKRIGDLHENIVDKEDFVIPLIRYVNEKELHNGGVAVFSRDGHKMVGELNEEETESLNIILDNYRSGVFKVKFKEKLVSIEAKRVRSRLSAKKTDMDEIKFRLDIQIEGSLEEVFGNPLKTPEDTEKLEKAFAKKIASDVKRVIEKAQTDLRTDILGFSEYLNNYDHSTWKQIKKDWLEGRELFKDVQTDVNVRTYIAHPGSLTKEKK